MQFWNYIKLHAMSMYSHYQSAFFLRVADLKVTIDFTGTSPSIDELGLSSSCQPSARAQKLVRKFCYFAGAHFMRSSKGGTPDHASFGRKA